MSPTMRRAAPSSPISRRSSSVTPCQPLRGPRRRASAAGEPSGTDAAAPGSAPASGSVAHRRRSCVSAEASHSAPATASLTRTSSPMTLAAIDAELAAERHELAQLVLGEDRVRLALRVLEDPAALGGDDRRRRDGLAGPARVRVTAGRRAASPARGGSTRSRPGPGGRVTARRAGGEAAARDERPRGAHAGPRGRRRTAERVRVAAVARGRADRVRRRTERVVDRLVAHPAAAAPREALGRGVERLGESRASSAVRPATAIPASMNAVPYSEPPAPPTLATSSCPRSRSTSPASRQSMIGADRAHARPRSPTLMFSP